MVNIASLTAIGDAIKCPLNISHWHGASADTAFVQIAITNTQNGQTVWLQPVTNEEYLFI